MTKTKRLVLDVLKPRKPGIVKLAESLAALGPHYRVSIDVKGVDEKTEDVFVSIEAEHVDFEAVIHAISSLGASVHSTDRVEVVGVENEESA